MMVGVAAQIVELIFFEEKEMAKEHEEVDDQMIEINNPTVKVKLTTVSLGVIIVTFGHIERYCRLKETEEKQENFVEEKDTDESECLFFASYTTNVCFSDVWYIDSGCSSHMTANLAAFIILDRSARTSVKMANRTIRKTKGKGVVKLNSCRGSCIQDILYVPDLDSNLLSVGQFLKEVYSLLF